MSQFPTALYCSFGLLHFILQKPTYHETCAKCVLHKEEGGGGGGDHTMKAKQ